MGLTKNLGWLSKYITADSVGNIGVGTLTPELKTSIVGEGGAFPATSGTSQTGALRLEQEGSNMCADFGSNGPSGAWLQVTNKTNLAQVFPFLLNPNGGNIGIGTGSTTPVGILHLKGAYIYPNFGNNMLNIEDSLDNYSGIVFTGTSGFNAAIRSDGANTLTFWTAGANKRMTISSSGNVLINTATDAGYKLDVNGTTRFIGTSIVSQSSAAIVTKQIGNGNNQGEATNSRIVRHYPVVSAGTKLIIPFVSQGNLNSTTIIDIMGHSAMWNTAVPRGFKGFIQVGHLGTISTATLLSSSGNISSISINGSNLEINFTNAYTSATANGVYVTIDYMTNVTGWSISVANITMN